jgi:two-component system, sensor histidine kinase and response regulator
VLPMKLLIAEDDALFRNILWKALAPHYELVWALDGDEAWTILQAPDAPPLALLDWVMPGRTGPQLCREIRSCNRLSAMYLILFTARNSAADVASGLRAGADDYITKPFRPEDLLARVRLGENTIEWEEAAQAQLISPPNEPQGSAQTLDDSSILPSLAETSLEENSYVMHDCILGHVSHLALPNFDCGLDLGQYAVSLPSIAMEKVHA